MDPTKFKNLMEELRRGDLTPSQRIKLVMDFYVDYLRAQPGSNKQLYNQFGIHVGEDWCVNLLAAVTAAAGYEPPSGAHVTHVMKLPGTKIDPQAIEPGDIVVSLKHTGTVHRVHRDKNGKIVAYDVASGNTIMDKLSKGYPSVGIRENIPINSGEFTFMRHSGQFNSRKILPPIFAEVLGQQAVIFSSALDARRKVPSKSILEISPRAH